MYFVKEQNWEKALHGSKSRIICLLNDPYIVIPIILMLEFYIFVSNVDRTTV